MKNKLKFLCFTLAILMFSGMAWAELDEAELKVIENTAENTAVEQPQALSQTQPSQPPQSQPAIVNSSSSSNFDPTRYTLGPEDVVEITVLRHPEFSAVYPVNLEGKIQYKFVGDIVVTGLTKNGLEEKIKELVSKFILNPEVNVTILEYKSKVIYVLGEVGSPGKYFMRSESIPVREAVVVAGLPTTAAAMRKCRLITPSGDGKVITKMVDLYTILYGGNLKNNLVMKPGDVLYVPATVMAKILRIITPVTAPVTTTASAVSSGAVLVP